MKNKFDSVMFVWYILTHPNDRLYRLLEEAVTLLFETHSKPPIA